MDLLAAAQLADRLTTALHSLGIATTPVRTLDYALEFELVHADRSFYSMLGPVNDGERQWLWTSESKQSMLRRLFGASDAPAHTAVLAAMDRCARILGAQSIRWYEADTWNDAPDEGWHRDPVV